MRIGYAVDLHGSAAPSTETTGWAEVKQQALTAEELGFDLVVLPDQFGLRLPTRQVGFWDSMSMAGALAAVTSEVGISHSMVNSPYRSPALVAQAAATLHEVSGGRYALGLGAGNSDDYAAVGVAGDRRRSRLAEALEIIHGLLREGAADVRGEHWSAERAELVLRDSSGPPLVVAAWGPRMMRLAARYADAWNGWTSGGPDRGVFTTMLEELERACDEVGRDPATLRRTLDVQVDPRAESSGAAPGVPLAGEPSEIADVLLGWQAELGIDEVRCYPLGEESGPDRLDALEALAGVVERVHAA